MKQPTISNLQFTIINACITTLCQSPRTLTKSTIPTPLIIPTPFTVPTPLTTPISSTTPTPLTVPTTPTAPTAPILCPCGSHLPSFRLVPLRGSL